MVRVFFELKPYPANRDIPKPIMSIIFQNPNNPDKIFKTICILDSGADFCTLPLEAQASLGMDLEKMGAEKVRVNCACGNPVFGGYKFKINAIFQDQEKNSIAKLLWVHFVKSDTYSLLGRNFMNIFKMMIYEIINKKGYFEDIIDD